MKIEIRLSNFEECNSCLLLNDLGQADERFKCRFYRINLEYDTRHRIKRPEKCTLDNGR